MPGDVTRLYRVRYVVVDESGVAIKSIRDRFEGMNLEVSSAMALTKLFSAGLADLGKQTVGLRQIEVVLRRIDYALLQAAKTTNDLAGGFVKVVAAKGGIEALVGAQVKAQRSAYGWKKNLEEANLAMANVVAKNPMIAAMFDPLNNMAVATGKAKNETKGLSAGMGGFLVKMAGLSVATAALHTFGDAMRDARDFAKDSADEVIRIRDGLRELANLQGKPGVDDATLAGTIQLRQASGMSDQEAKQFQEQFLGSLPLAKQKGNIDEATALATAAEVARSSVRVGLDAKTAGDLAGSIGAFGPIKSSKAGAGQVQQIIDQLNDGRGNLTPLVKELMKGGAATVGEGNAFRSLPERAAALRVTTGIVGSPGQASTALGAAIRGLTGFTKAQGETLAGHGIRSGMDLPTMLDRIAPLLHKAQREGKNPSATLAEAGFGNIQDRNAIVGLVANRQVLRSAVESVREEGVDPTKKAELAGDRAIGLNRQFFGADKAAANRVAEANLTAGKVQRGLENEPLAIARKTAEGELIAEKKLDTVGSNLEQKLRNLIGFSALSGMDARQDDIDARVRANLRKAGGGVGVKVRAPSFSLGSESAARQEINAYGPSITARGGNPYGGAAQAPLAGPDVGRKLDRIAEALEKRDPARVGPRALPGPPVVEAERR